MTVLTQTYIRFRWLQLPAMALMFLLQRTPVLRAIITTEFTLHATAGTVLKGVLASAAAMGTVHTVAGATELSAGTTGNPITGTVGKSFTGGFAVTGAPAVAGSYRITGSLPAGLAVTDIDGQTVNGSVVTITGTPTEAGTFPLGVKAWKGANRTQQGGAPTFTYTIVIEAAAGTAPTISAQPQGQTVNAGKSVTFSVTAGGDPAPTFQWRRDGTNIPGAISASFSISNTVAGDAGAYSVVVTNASGSVTSSAVNLTINSVSSEATITRHPVSQTVAPGGAVTFSVDGTGPSSPSFQWNKNGVVLAGKTSNTLTLNSLSEGDTGRYTVTIVVGSESLVSRDAYLLVATPQAGAIVNESVNTTVGPGASLTVGFVVDGGSRQMLIRGAGPSLAGFGISSFLPQPVLQLNATGSNARVIATNEGWNNNSAIAAAGATVGAFAFSSPEDAAVLETLDGGPYTAVMTSGDASSGTAIVEAYASGNGSGQLVNMSARKRIDNANQSLTAGFSINGNVPKRVLIRAVGPSLNQFLNGAELDDSTLTLNRLIGPAGEAVGVVLANDDWHKEGNAAEIITVAASVGAFPLVEGGADAAVLVTLPTGNYTVQVGRKGQSVGDALIEVYAVP